MRSRSKRGSMMMEIMAYLIFAFMISSLFLRFYIAMVKDYNEALDFYLVTDYTYQTFETLKVDLYTNRESFLVKDHVLYLKKSDYVNGNLIELTQRGNRLIYLYGTKVMELCHNLKDVKMRSQGDLVFITLIFEGVSYERVFYLGN